MEFNMCFLGFCSTRFWARRLMWLVFLYLSFFESFSPPISFAAEARKDKTPPLEMRISYVSNGGVFSESYKAEEYLTKLFALIAKSLPVEPIFVPSNVEKYVEFSSPSAEEPNIIALLGKSPERMFQLKYSQHPIANTEIFLVTDKNKDIYYNDIQDMHGKSVAIYSNNSYAKNMLDDYLMKNNISMEYKIYTDFEQYVLSKADYHLINSFYFIKGKQLAVSLGKQELYLAVKPKYISYLQKLDTALSQVKKYDSAALDELHREYVSKSTLFVGQHYGKEEQKRLDGVRKTAQVGFLAKHYPIQYVNEKGEPSGISIEVLNLFKQMHTAPTSLVSYEPNSSANVKNFDMLFSIVGDKEVKEEFFYRSRIYATLPMVLFKRNDSATPVKERRFGMLDYSVLNHAQVKSGFPHWKMEVFTTYDAMLQAYEKNRIDALLLSSAEAEYVISQLGMLNSELVSTPVKLPLVFYLSKRFPPQALTVLNAFIDRLQPLAVQSAIIDAENAMRAPGTMEEFIYENKFALSSLLGLLCLILISLYMCKISAEKRKLRKIINTDILTGLSSKVHAYEIIERVLKKAQPGEYFVLCVDIDKFSLLNQVYGRDKANDILRLMANVLREQSTKDVKPECIARLRDDVFLVLTKTPDNQEEYAPMECKLGVTYGVKDILQSDYNISLSIGGYIVEDVTLPVETIIDYCNAARYKGKSEHGISLHMFSEPMKRKIEAQKRIIYRMEQALDNEEFILNFQPKVALDSSYICGAEVLVRWQPSNAPPIYPDDFISVFEDNAFIARLDMYVFEKTCKFINDTRKLYHTPPLAVNLSGISILHDDTNAHMQKLLHTYDISPDEIEIEITESALVAESDTFLNAIESIRKLGFKIAIDDFGTGVSSLHRLSSLRVDFVKLDKAFLDDKLNQKKGIILVASMINMLHRLDMKVIAEGVETERHVTILKKMRCDMVQGYYFFKPLSENEFVQNLSSVIDLSIHSPEQNFSRM